MDVRRSDPHIRQRCEFWEARPPSSLEVWRSRGPTPGSTQGVEVERRYPHLYPRRGGWEARPLSSPEVWRSGSKTLVPAQGVKVEIVSTRDRGLGSSIPISAQGVEIGTPSTQDEGVGKPDPHIRQKMGSISAFADLSSYNERLKRLRLQSPSNDAFELLVSSVPPRDCSMKCG
ncbi:hypothetical protein BHM03_00040540 [Ensete ventricosum]|nr:hypothetical protein BHM03_00040540 [Ensete ventricosum]